MGHFNWTYSFSMIWSRGSIMYEMHNIYACKTANSLRNLHLNSYCRSGWWGRVSASPPPSSIWKWTRNPNLHSMQCVERSLLPFTIGQQPMFNGYTVKNNNKSALQCFYPTKPLFLYVQEEGITTFWAYSITQYLFTFYFLSALIAYVCRM